jgi:DNA repair photolyase
LEKEVPTANVFFVLIGTELILFLLTIFFNMIWDKIDITNSIGEKVNAQAPLIVSASRSTDIPAFYSDWLIQRIKDGYVKWKNPYNGIPLYVSFLKARLIVFWSKNPKPIISHLPFIESKIPNYYFQFTLNDYDKEKLEPNVPQVNQRIDTFLQLSELIGKEKVIWRFDPLVLTDKIGVNELLKKVESIGNQLSGYTSKLVFSFADINLYKKVRNNLLKSKIKYQEFNERLMIEFAEGLWHLNKKWNYDLSTCAEKVSLEKYNIAHNKCIDDELILKLFSTDKILMDFLGIKFIEPDLYNPTRRIEHTKSMKDKGQRQLCGCIVSKDIGEYNTCPHLCEYCYANSSKEVALKNWNFHLSNPLCEMIKGE